MKKTDIKTNTNLKNNEFLLLKSKDDLTLEHNKNTPLYKLTGFSGTAGEAIQDYKGKITLFVDPRYHIQAEKETKEKNVKVVKLDMKTSFTSALKAFLKPGDTLYIPSKSTKISTFKTFKKELKGIILNPYDTEDALENSAKIENVPENISGLSYNKKIEKIRQAARGKSLFLTSLEDVSYILNLRCFNTPNTSVIRAKMLISPDMVYVFSDSALPKLNGIKTLPLKDIEKTLKKIEATVLIDENNITINDFNLVKNPRPLKKNPVQKMASIKTGEEIRHYKEAFKRLDDALYSFQKKIKPGLSELELKNIFEKELIIAGAKCTSFKTILALSENSSSIHYSNYDKNKIIKDGDILLIDCGGYYEGGYATDITRVFICGKTPLNPKVKEIYTAVLKAQLNVFFGRFEDTKSMDDKARKILKPYEKEGFLFPHSLGHGVGIPVHQAPPTLTLNPEYNSKLKKNMVFTIEPGLYKEGEFGIRLENTVYFDKKNIALSKFPYEENLIDKTLLNKKEAKWLETWQKGLMNDE